MIRAKKEAVIAKLKPKFESTHFYITDCNGLNANQMYLLRKMLYKEDIECRFVANAFLQILFSETVYAPLTKVLQGNSVVFFTKQNPSIPAKIIKKFKRQNKTDKPILKAAWAFEEVFIGKEHFKTLLYLKSKDERISDLLHQLQSPIIQLVNALQSSKDRLLGMLKTLETK